MSSTDDEKAFMAARAFYDAHLESLAERVRREGCGYFSVRPDAADTTAYVRRTRTEMAPADFEQADVTTPEELERRLCILWEAQGCAELLPLARPLARLAHDLRTDEEQDADVSPFIYVMF